MSNTNGQVSFVKSMNGILSFNTGSGTTIEGDSITTDIINCDTLNTTNFNATNLNTNNIQGTTPSSNITLYTNSTNEIHIGSPNSLNYVDGPLYVDNIFGTTTGTAFIYPNVVSDINIGSSIIPITGNYVCTASNHLANKGYVDSMAGVNLIPLPNIWTGTSNTYNNKIVLNAIEALSAGATVDLFPNLTTGLINIGVNATTTGAINIGNSTVTGSFSVSQGTININPKTTLNMANQIGAGTVNICNSNNYAGTINLAATAHSTAVINTLNIGSTTSNITIKSSTLSLNSATDIDILKPLTPSYPYDATNGTSATAGTALIGQLAPITLTTILTLTAGTLFTRVCRYDNVPAGIYMAYFYAQFQCTVANSSITNINLYIGSGQSISSPKNYDDFLSNFVCGNLTLNSGRTTGYSVNYPLIITATTNINYQIGIGFTGGTITIPALTDKTCRLMRIA